MPSRPQPNLPPVLISRLNLKPADTLRHNSSWHTQTLQETGADGWLWSDIAIGGLWKQQARAGNILAVHQSWRTDTPGLIGRRAWQTFRTQGFRAGLREGIGSAQFLVLPHLSTSLASLLRVQREAGKKLPAVAHPKEQVLGPKEILRAPDYTKYRGFYSQLLYQPTAELITPWGITQSGNNAPYVARQLNRAADQRGFDGAAIDLQWLLERRNGEVFDDPEGLSLALAETGQAKRYQLNWQPDLAHNPSEVMYELQAALSGNLAATRRGQILARAARHLGSEMGPIDVEVKAETLALAGITDYVEGNRRLVEQTRTVVAQAMLS